MKSLKKNQPQIQNTLVKLQKLSVLAKQGNHLRDIKNTIWVFMVLGTALYIRPYERTKTHKTEMGLGPLRHLKVVAVVVFSDL